MGLPKVCHDMEITSVSVSQWFIFLHYILFGARHVILVVLLHINSPSLSLIPPLQQPIDSTVSALNRPRYGIFQFKLNTSVTDSLRFFIFPYGQTDIAMKLLRNLQSIEVEQKQLDGRQGFIIQYELYSDVSFLFTILTPNTRSNSTTTTLTLALCVVDTQFQRWTKQYFLLIQEGLKSVMMKHN